MSVSTICIGVGDPHYGVWREKHLPERSCSDSGTGRSQAPLNLRLVMSKYVAYTTKDNNVSPDRGSKTSAMYMTKRSDLGFCYLPIGLSSRHIFRAAADGALLVRLTVDGGLITS